MTSGGADAVEVAGELNGMLVLWMPRSPPAPGSEKVTLALEPGVRLYLEDEVEAMTHVPGCSFPQDGLIKPAAGANNVLQGVGEMIEMRWRDMLRMRPQAMASYFLISSRIASLHVCLNFGTHDVDCKLGSIQCRVIIVPIFIACTP
jgi:hypothetical protein